MVVLPIRPAGSGEARLEAEDTGAPFLRPAREAAPISGLLGTTLGLLRRVSALVNMAGGSIWIIAIQCATPAYDAIAPELRKRIPSGGASAPPRAVVARVTRRGRSSVAAGGSGFHHQVLDAFGEFRRPSGRTSREQHLQERRSQERRDNHPQGDPGEHTVVESSRG